MALTMGEARKVVLENLPEGTVIESGVLYDGLFLFIAYRPDPLEGHLDPFFSVDPKTGYFRDFSPSNYPEPVKVIKALEAAS